jgi:hypothetical protein
MISRFINKIGMLRALLSFGVLIVIITAPFADAPVVYSGWAMFPTLIAPALVPILFFVYPLELTMTRIFMSDKEGEERARYKFILWVDIIMLLGLVIVWLPFFLRLLQL